MWDLAFLCLALVPSVAAHVSIRCRSLGYRKSAIFAALHALVAVGAGVLLFSVEVRKEKATTLAVAWLLFAVSALLVAIFLRVRGKHEQEFFLDEPRRIAFRAWLGLAVLEGALLAALEFEGAALPLLLAVFGLTPLVFGLRALRLARLHRGNQDYVRAWFGALLGIAYLAVPVVPLLALAFGGFGKLLVLMFVSLLATFVVSLPFSTRLLVGARAPALDLTPAPMSRARAYRRALIVLTVVGVLSAALLATSIARHYGRCGGALLPAPSPGETWRQWPVVPNRVDTSLGPFNFRAEHDSDSRYPVPYRGAKLSDPNGCFTSTISLESWFGENDMYRNPGELRLRHDPRTDVFVVSGALDNDPEQFVAAFTRDRAWRFAFDLPMSGWCVGLGMIFLLSGAVTAVSWRRNCRMSPEHHPLPDPRAARLLLVAALVPPVLLEVRWTIGDLPRPGAEIFNTGYSLFL